MRNDKNHLPVATVASLVHNHIMLKFYSNTTAKAYKSAIRLYLEEAIIGDPTKYSSIDIYAVYEKIVTSKNLSARAAAKLLNGIVYYYEQYLGYAGHCDSIPRPKRSKPVVNTISDVDVFYLLKAAQNNQIRDAMQLAVYAGLRISEICQLKQGDINLVDKTITVRKGKNNKGRIVIMSERMYNCAYFSMNYNSSKEDYVTTVSTVPSTQRNLQKLFAIARNKTGVDKRVTIHSLRHKYAENLLKAGVDVRTISLMLGHANLASTEHYLRGVNSISEEMRDRLSNIK
jgi:integrase/recombinase XerD